MKRVRIGGLRIPPSLGIGGYKVMTAKEVKAVTDLGMQETLRKNAWQSASLLLLAEEKEKEGRRPPIVDSSTSSQSMRF